MPDTAPGAPSGGAASGATGDDGGSGDGGGPGDGSGPGDGGPAHEAGGPARHGGRRVGRWLVVAAVVLVAGAAWWLAGSGGECEPPAGVRPGLCVTPAAERPMAPTTALPVLGNQSQTLSIDQFDGDVVVINFWGSWCVPCRTEQPDLNEVASAYADDGVSFVGVDVNEVSETNGLRHEESLEIPYPSMWDPDFSYAGDFEVAGPRVMPSTVVVDRQGRVAVAIHGATTDTELSALLDEVLAGSAAGSAPA